LREEADELLVVSDRDALEREGLLGLCGCAYCACASGDGSPLRAEIQAEIDDLVVVGRPGGQEQATAAHIVAACTAWPDALMSVTARATGTRRKLRRSTARAAAVELTWIGQ
jgi:hypothetical protein